MPLLYPIVSPRHPLLVTPAHTVLLALSTAPPASAGGQPAASSPDPILQAILDTLARLTTRVVYLETHKRPLGELAGRECSATPLHTHPSVAPVLPQDAQYRPAPPSVPAREETRDRDATGMPNARLPGAIVGVTPSHQATQIGSAAKANGGQPLAVATVPSVPHVDNAGAFLALPHAPRPAVALPRAAAGGAVNNALGPKDRVSGSTWSCHMSQTFLPPCRPWGPCLRMWTVPLRFSQRPRSYPRLLMTWYMPFAL